MNFWEFIIAFLHEIAWPCAAVALAALLRKEIKTLLPRISRLKAWGVEAELNLAVDKLSHELPKQITEASSSSSSSSSPRVVHPLTTVQKSILKEVITENLTKIERLFIIFYYYEEMTYEQIANNLGLPINIVRNMHGSILDRLKTELAVTSNEATE